ncbi:MAG: Flp pilus assembly protein CpaB [Acidobacteria bacterium]|jgi:pilus assembly protein CpaB|nr:Flp pilus assembly protein CpaB [Bryobacteraceae bacterium CoA2 C42]
MDRRFLLVLGVSLVFALVVSGIFYQMTMRASTTAPTVARVEEKDVVVAAKPLTVGATIKPGDVKIAKVTASQFPRGAFSTVEEVMDRPLTSNILLDEPIQEGRLAARGSGLGIAPIIPVGMRAVSVRVTEVVGVAGFVLPGMRVDILLTGKPPDSFDVVTTTVLQNITVLSAGQTYQPDAKGQAINASTVTLLVSPDQAETLTLASQEGRIQLVLRNGSDHNIEKPPGREVRQLFGARRSSGSTPPVGGPPHDGTPQDGDAEGQSPFRVPRPRPTVIPAGLEATAPPPPAAAPPPPDEIVSFRGTVRTVEVVTNRKN